MDEARDELRNEVRHELKRIRHERGMTQRQLAKRAGITQTTLALIETGRRSPSVETLRRLAEALGVEVADFFPKAEPSLFDAPAQWGRLVAGPSADEWAPRSGARFRVSSAAFFSHAKLCFKKVEQGEMTAEEALRELEEEYATR